MEITYDPHEDSCVHFLEVGEDHEVMPEWGWLRWLRREMEDPKLFVYRHRKTRRFMLCQWLYTPEETCHPVAQELEGFADESSNGWPSDLMHPQVLKARLTPTHDIIKKHQNKLREAEHRKRSEMLDRAEVRKDMVKRLKSVGLEREAHKVSIGAVPVGVPSEGTKEMARELARS
jgi:hypothetical protein